MLMDTPHAAPTAIPDRFAWVQLECPSCGIRDAVILEHGMQADVSMQVIQPSARFRVIRFASDPADMMFGCIRCQVPAAIRSIRSESSTRAFLAAYPKQQDS
jgi:hypothetical protein